MGDSDGELMGETPTWCVSGALYDGVSGEAAISAVRI